MLARSLTRPVDLVVFDEPTVGVDVGTRQAIYRLHRRAGAGRGLRWSIVSSDLPEILNLAHRAYVFHQRSHVQAELAGEALTEDRRARQFL